MCVFCHNIHCHVTAKILDLRGGLLIKGLCSKIENALSKHVCINEEAFLLAKFLRDELET
jgi:hypothetical protein